MTFARPARAALLTLAVSFVLAATLYPAGGERSPEWQGCIVCGEKGLADVLVNIILFMPLGAGLALTRWGALRLTITGWLLSGAVECAQFFIPGRDPSLGDLLFNTLGTLAGAALVRTAPWWLRPRATTVATLAGTVIAVAAIGGTLALLGPQLPHSTYYGQWTANLEHLFWYRGRVLAATLGGTPLPPHRLTDSEAARGHLLAGDTLQAAAVAGPRPPRFAPLVSIFDDHQREIVILGIEGDDLVWRRRTWAARFGLDQPDVRWRDALRGSRRGDRFTVAVWRERRGWCLARDAASRCGLGPTPGRAWALLMYPESLPPWMQAALDGCWVAGLCLPLGLWGRRAGPRTAVPAGAAVAAALVVAPLLAATPAVPLIEWAGAGAGGALGAAFSRWWERWSNAP
jgi:VanZ family protein